MFLRQETTAYRRPRAQTLSEMYTHAPPIRHWFCRLWFYRCSV